MRRVAVLILSLSTITFAAEVQMQQRVSYDGWPNCVRLTNGQVELIVTTDVGPRVIRFGFVGGQNLFKEFKDQVGKTGGDEWRGYGGHRLWDAPGAAPPPPFPPNVPGKDAWGGKTLKLNPPIGHTKRN